MKLSIFANGKTGRDEHGEPTWGTITLNISDRGKDDVYIYLGKTMAKVKRQDLIGLAANILIAAVRGGSTEAG